VCGIQLKLVPAIFAASPAKLFKQKSKHGMAELKIMKNGFIYVSND